MIEHVAVMGARFAGTLQAINLLRHEGPRATLIERAPVAGTGLAYGAAHPSHVLNVRAANMSPFPDDRIISRAGWNGAALPIRRARASRASPMANICGRYWRSRCAPRAGVSA